MAETLKPRAVLYTALTDVNNMSSNLTIISLAIVLFVALSAAFFMESYNNQGQNPLKKFASAEEMQNFIKANQGQDGFGDAAFASRVTSAAGAQIAQAESAGQKTLSAGSDDYSGTNIQVEGVDEPDIIKTDGKYIYTISQESLVILDAYPGENANIVSTTALNGSAQEIFVSGNKLVVFGYTYEKTDVQTSPPLPAAGQEKMIAGASSYYYPQYTQRAFIKVFDIGDRSNPVLKKDIKMDGEYYDARMIGSHVYAIINQPIQYRDGVIPLPMEYTSGKASPAFAYTDVYYFDYPDYSYRFTDIVSLNLGTEEEKHNPYLLGYAQNLFVSQDNIYITGTKQFRQSYFEDAMVTEVIIPAVPANVGAELSAIQKSNATYYDKSRQLEEALNKYMNTLSEEQKRDLETQARKRADDFTIRIQKEMQKTIVHKISVSNGKVEYKAHGEVPGTPLNQFSMDEHNGYFRIATTTRDFGSFGGFGGGIATTQVSGQQIASVEEIKSDTSSGGGITIEENQQLVKPAASAPTSIAPSLPVVERPTTLNHIYVLDANMNIVGKLEDLAPGESIYSARFIGDRAYMVTFKKIDPLFVIDLSTPSAPKVLGKLKIPGYSDYLHPYDENHIIGIGKEAAEAKQGDFAWYQGVKLALFDVSDVENPKEIAKYNIGDRGTDSEALREHKAFLFSKEKNLLVIPVLLAEINKEQYPQGIPDFTYGDYKFQGAYVFELTAENGFVLKGRVTHVADDSFDKSGYYYFSPYSVKRSLYIGNQLYTLSDGMLKINNLADLSEVKWIELPYTQYYYGFEETKPMIVV